jgi:ferredoxin
VKAELEVDSSRCIGSGNCEFVAPWTFRALGPRKRGQVRDTRVGITSAPTEPLLPFLAAGAPEWRRTATHRGLT